jgi:hypothetical protein
LALSVDPKTKPNILLILPEQGLQCDFLVENKLRNAAQAILLVGDSRLKDPVSVNFGSSGER